MIVYTINSNNYIENLQCPDWVHVITDVEDLGDPIRNSRKDKILCPFDGESVYVDASKVHLLNDKFLELSKEIFTKEKFFILQHPHKQSYLEECAEYVYNGWVDEKTLLEYTEKLKHTSFRFDKFFSPLCTILWRKNMTDFNNLWWEWYMMGGIRDQLSFSVALQLSGIDYEYQYCRDFINQFSSAGPGGGEWWKNKCGDYKYFPQKDPKKFVEVLSKNTKLSTKLRYRTHFDNVGKLIIGRR